MKGTIEMSDLLLMRGVAIEDDADWDDTVIGVEFNDDVLGPLFKCACIEGSNVHCHIPLREVAVCDCGDLGVRCSGSHCRDSAELSKINHEHTSITHYTERNVTDEQVKRILELWEKKTGRSATTEDYEDMMEAQREEDD